MIKILPYLTAFIAMISYSSLVVIAKKMLPNIPPFAFIMLTMFFLFLFAALASGLYEKSFGSISTFTKHDWIGVIGFAIVNLIAFSTYLWAINYIPVTQYQLIYLVSPLVVAFLAFLFLGEEFHMRYLLSLILISAGIYIAIKG